MNSSRRLFDEPEAIAQTPLPMRLNRFFSVKTLACLGFACAALHLNAAELVGMEDRVRFDGAYYRRDIGDKAIGPRH